MKNVVSLLFTLGLVTVGPSAFAKGDHEKRADEINELLRGEISAVETYDQALKKLGNESEGKPLREILQNHRDSAKKLEAEVRSLKAEPSTDSGAWGTWAKTVEGSAKVMGDDAALKALKEGEEHGLKEYQDALDKNEVPAKVKTLIRSSLIERQKKNIASLDKLMESN
jgi:uncharacterized protein (TIGR02284 family)